MSSKDYNEERVMHSKSDKVEIMINNKADRVIEELSQSFFSRYQIELNTSMKGSDFVFDCVHLFYYKCHKMNLERVGSYKDSPDSVKNKKATINVSTERIINAFNML